MTKCHKPTGSQRVAMRERTTAYYFLQDHLGSTALTLDNSGVKVGETRYDVWGKTIYQSDTMHTNCLYTGQLWDGKVQDDGTGLYFYNARYYDPALGRFTQADTIVPEPANPQTLNRFAYTLNNPIRYTDPTGHFSRDAVITYLKETYGDEWELYLTQWEENTDFWNMLMDAEGGDVLLTNFGVYTFAGAGQNILSGIYLSDELGNPIGCECEEVMLHDFALGHTGSDSLIWYANVRWTGSKTGKEGTFYLNPAYIVAQGTYTGWQGVGVNVAFGFAGLGVSLLTAGLDMPIKIQVLAGSGFALISGGGFPSTTFNMNSTDQYLMFFSGTEIRGQFINHVNPMWADYTLLYSSQYNLTIRNGQ